MYTAVAFSARKVWFGLRCVCVALRANKTHLASRLGLCVCGRGRARPGGRETRDTHDVESDPTLGLCEQKSG